MTKFGDNTLPRGMTVRICRTQDGYDLTSTLSDIETLGVIGKAQKVVQGDNTHGTLFPPRCDNKVAPKVELYYEIRSDIGKVTIISTETQYGTMDLLKNGVNLIKQVW